ncbi:MAG: transposase family protein [Alkaliphilus sp.]
MKTQKAFFKEFFPKYFIYSHSAISESKVILHFSTKKRYSTCPKCDVKSINFATYYTRTIQDLPILDKSTYVKIKLRKMSCDNIDCKVKYFNEALTDYVNEKKRYSNRLLDLLMKIALTETAEGGARICREQKIIVSGDKLLQLAKEFELVIDKESITRVGVDDFALKKNIDMELL